MELIPRAKPIYIRIKLGDNEYSNLDDVCKHLVVKDLYPLFLDGRLARWLKQIGRSDLAAKAEEVLIQHHEDRLIDYLYFMSLFDSDLKTVLEKADCTDEEDLYNFLNSEADDSLLFRMVESLSGIAAFDGGAILREHMSMGSFERLLLNSKTRSLLSPSEIGNKLAELADTPENGRKTLLFLGQNIELDSILKEFWRSSNFLKLFDGLSVDGLNEFYVLDGVRALIGKEQWGEAFFSVVKDWEADSQKVTNLLKTKEEIMSFLVIAKRNGCVVTQEELDPWSYIHVTNDYQNVMRALKTWNSSNYYKEKYGYSQLETVLGRQILDFLAVLSGANRFSNLVWIREKQSVKLRDDEDYLANERKIVECIASRNPSLLKGDFSSVGRKVLSDLRTQGNPLAGKLLDVVKVSKPSNDKLLSMLVESIAVRLENQAN